jgi:hypothetical protein
MIGAPQGPAQEPNSQLAGAEVRTELVNMNDEPHSQSVIKARKESAICAYCSELVTVCWLHSVTVTCRRPIA